MSDKISPPSPSQTEKLAPYLPQDQHGASSNGRPFVTLTFATSLDSTIAMAPGARTALSGPESKAMTHFLRSQHDAICVGAGTALADDPGLNCRTRDASHQPRPIVIDPKARWHLDRDAKVLRVASSGQGLAPFIIVAAPPEPSQRDLLEEHGGKFLVLPTDLSGRFSWTTILESLHQQEGIKSIMIEGGEFVINTLLSPVNQALVDSIIVTIAPQWLGKGGVVVSPDRVTQNGIAIPAAKLQQVVWVPFGADIVLCGRLNMANVSP